MIIFFTGGGSGGGGMGLLTADNGLTATGTNVELSGPLTKNTVVDITGFSLNMGGLKTVVDFDDVTPEINFNVDDGTGTTGSDIYMTTGISGQLLLEYYDTTSNQTIQMSDGIITIHSDSAASVGTFRTTPFGPFLEYFDNTSGLHNTISVDATGIGIDNSIANTWAVYGGDYSSLSTGNPRSIPDLAYIQGLIGLTPGIVQSLKVPGITTSQSFTPFAVPGLTSIMYRLNMSAVIRSLGVASSLQLQVDYTDGAGNARTEFFFNQGDVTSLQTVTQATAMPPMNIQAEGGTNITFSANVIGTCVYDIGLYIEQIL